MVDPHRGIETDSRGRVFSVRDASRVTGRTRVAEQSEGSASEGGGAGRAVAASREGLYRGRTAEEYDIIPWEY